MDLWSIRSLFTPSVLFVLLNLVIGTIAVISTRHRRHHDDNNQQHGGRPIARSSSSNVLERVRSLGLFRFRSGDLPPIISTTTDDDDDDDTTTHLDHAMQQQEYEIGHSQHQQVQHQQQQQMRRIHSESDSKVKKKTEETNHTMKMKKSVSSMSTSCRRSEEVVEGRPATTLIKREASVDDEVDAKADDFINRFKSQLKLQRLDSILRYKEMLTNKN